MKNGKKRLALAMVLAMTAMPAYGYTQTKIIQYDETKLIYNNEDKTLLAPPINIEGTTYLPLRAMSDLIGVNIGWNQDTKTVSMNTSLTTNTSLQAELQAKNYEITMLRQELDTLKAQLNTTTHSSSTYSYDTTYGTDILGTELTATRRLLEDEYANYFSEVDFDFYLSLSGSRLKVLISLEGTSNNREFRRLSTSQIKNFVEDVCEEIRARHDNIIISGEIENDDTSKTLYTFSYSKSDKLTFSSSSESSSSSSYYYDDDVSKELERIVNNAGRVYIDDYDTNIAIKSFYVRDMTDSTIYASMYLDVSTAEGAKDAWNAHVGYNNNSELRRYLYNFCDDLRENYNIIYTLYDYKSGTVLGTYDYDSNRVDLNTIS